MGRTAQRERAVERIGALCQSQLDPLSLRQELVELLRTAVPFDGCALVVCDPDCETATSFLLEGADVAFVPAVIHNELLVDDFNKFTDLARSLWPVGILSEVTYGRRERSARYRDILAPQGKHDELRASCVVDGARWGSVTLDRERGRPDFDTDDARLIARFAGQIGTALRRGILSVAIGHSSDQRAGVILLDGDDRIEGITPAGERWLAELSEGGALPGAIHQVIERVRATSAEAAVVTPRLRVLTTAGHWVIVHGASVSGSGASPGGVAVVIESAASTEIAPLVLQAHGLSAREREVAELLLTGRANKEIALALGLSPFTVQDNLKAIFEKTGVHSRAELAARVFGGRDPRQ